eukprot:CAMPEP_0115005726 /NCGR_PEP_ID=MMETSP0216-20121206/20057_1 /TAXON_ID=223996 /ORGANISM="Protocruzia adherens, Strain Boccale" /LENGTH=214 /DNA_ID=CAMNT_0002372135 /DNA_START=40 /DNA_END=684 /DNA_ORIENTATION=-
MAQYGRSDYWDERYTRDKEPFDWYQRWSGIKDVVTQHILPTNKILVLGCGNSRMSEEMFDDGFQNLTNIDISSVVIKDMQEKYADKVGMTFATVDACKMDYDGAFDAVLDKGTIDAVLCGEDSSKNVNEMLTRVYKSLTPNGVYVAITYGQPQHRLSYLTKSEFSWEVTQSQVAKPTISTTAALATDDKTSPNVHYIYICKKKGTNEGAEGETN